SCTCTCFWFAVFCLCLVVFFCCFFFFFFQAEDGIRDGHVTGVQTCALPISHFAARFCERHPAVFRAAAVGGGQRRLSVHRRVFQRYTGRLGDRSEERRVGKECRCRWGTEY